MSHSVPENVLTYLDSLEPGFFPAELFQRVTRLTVSPILELVPLRRNGTNIEVLMLTRPSDDPHWPSMLHTPGTYIRPTDTEQTLGSAFQRLLQEELLEESANTPFFVQTLFHRVKRGMELALVYGIDLTDSLGSLEGEWFSVNALPKNSVQTQHEFIVEASRLFERLDSKT